MANDVRPVGETQWFKMVPNGLAKKFNKDEGLGFRREPGTNGVVVSLITKHGAGPNQLIMTDYEFTADEWRQIERELQIAR